MKKVLGIILFTALLFGLTGCGKMTATGIGEVTIELYSYGEKVDSKTVEFGTGDTLLNLVLDQFPVYCNNDMTGEDTCRVTEPANVFISGIGSLVQNTAEGAYVMFYIDGVSASFGIGSTPLTDQGVYAFKLEIPQWG